MSRSGGPTIPPLEIQPDKWYLVEGNKILTFKKLTKSLVERVLLNDASLSTVAMVDALTIIYHAIPNNPPEAF